MLTYIFAFQYINITILSNPILLISGKHVSTFLGQKSIFARLRIFLQYLRVIYCLDKGCNSLIILLLIIVVIKNFIKVVNTSSDFQIYKHEYINVEVPHWHSCLQFPSTEGGWIGSFGTKLHCWLGKQGRAGEVERDFSFWNLQRSYQSCGLSIWCGYDTLTI